MSLLSNNSSSLWPSLNQTEDSNGTEWEPIVLARAIPISVILGSIICCTIGGNILVLLAVSINSHLRSTTSIFIANLAIADLLLGTTVLPFSASLEVTADRWLFGPTFCDIWAAMDVLCCTASILSLCVISLDRYIGVTRPLQHSNILTEKRGLSIALFVWILALMVSVGPLVGWKHKHKVPYRCTVTSELGYVLFSTLCSFYLPTACILAVYYRIYREALKQSKFLSSGVKKAKMKSGGDNKMPEGEALITLRVHTGRHQNQNSNTSEKNGAASVSGSHNSRLQLAGLVVNHETGKMVRFKREKKAAKTLGIVVGVFIICWLPFFFMLPLSAICGKTCQAPDILFKIAFWLGYCNSLCNPIIYACWNKEFKWAFRRILRCEFRRKPRRFTPYFEYTSDVHGTSPSTENTVTANTTTANHRTFVNHHHTRSLPETRELVIPRVTVSPSEMSDVKQLVQAPVIRPGESPIATVLARQHSRQCTELD